MAGKKKRVLSRLTKTFERKSTVKVIINDKFTLKDEKKFRKEHIHSTKKKTEINQNKMEKNKHQYQIRSLRLSIMFFFGVFEKF